MNRLKRVLIDGSGGGGGPGLREDKLLSIQLAERERERDGQRNAGFTHT